MTSCWCWPRSTAEPVAGALNFIGADTLFGRYWGCVEDHPCLHFELCYYQAIDWALAQPADAGRGRGAGRTQTGARLSARAVHSLHWFADPRFQQAVAEYLRAEAAAVGDEMADLETYGPFRRGPIPEEAE